MHSFIQLLLAKSSANLRTEVSRYYLNYLWWALEPVLTMLTFYVVFGIFLNRGTPNYVAFLLIGLVPWQWFANIVTQSSNSIVNGKGLMLQVNISKLFFPLEVAFRGTFKHFFVLALLLIFLIFYGLPITAKWLALPALLALQFLFILSISFLCAAIVPFIPDMQFIVATAIRLAMFASGVFYDINSVVLGKHRAFIYINPMAGLIKSYRDILLYEAWPDWHYLGILTLATLVLLTASSLLIIKFNYVYPRICQQ